MTTEAFDDALLQDYMHGFYGYGRYAAPYWFIGMEEGSSGKPTEIPMRTHQWHKRGRRELEDLVDYSYLIGMEGLLGSRARIQPTWAGLIKILLSAEGQDLDTESVRRFQREKLGRQDGTNALLELLPLPSRRLNKWLYAEHSRIPELANRQAYTRAYAPKRAEAIRQRIQQHKPEAVVFYSSSRPYRQWWTAIAGVEFGFEADSKVYVGRNADTIFIITSHPTAFGVSNRYWQRVAEIISAGKGHAQAGGSPAGE